MVGRGVFLLSVRGIFDMWGSILRFVVLEHVLGFFHR